MRSSSGILKLVDRPRIISSPVTFPLGQEVKEEIVRLQHAYRNSFEEYEVYGLGIAAPQIGVNKRFFIMPQNLMFLT